MPAYSGVENFNLYCVVDPDPEQIEKIVNKFNPQRSCQNLDQALEDPKIDAVIVASPPHLHYAQALQSLKSGRHVFSEKPVAFSGKEAERLFAEARNRNLQLSCNYVMRFNPFYRVLGEMINRKNLGNLDHFIFRNFAQDQTLPPEHWFWDPEKSGGIFIEHGVHFFDVFNSILGRGRVINSFSVKREKYDFIDRVQANLVYPGEIPGTFYHSFTRKTVMERNFLDIGFERGYVTLHEWIPTCMSGEVWLSKNTYLEFRSLLFEELPRLTGLTTNAFIKKNIQENRSVKKSRFLEIEEDNDPDLPRKPVFEKIDYQGPGEVYHNYTFAVRIEEGKTAVYRECIRKCMEDFVAGILNPGHKVIITPQDVISSIEIARECADRAQAVS